MVAAGAALRLPRLRFAPWILPVLAVLLQSSARRAGEEDDVFDAVLEVEEAPKISASGQPEVAGQQPALQRAPALAKVHSDHQPKDNVKVEEVLPPSHPNVAAKASCQKQEGNYFTMSNSSEASGCIACGGAQQTSREAKIDAMVKHEPEDNLYKVYVAASLLQMARPGWGYHSSVFVEFNGKAEEYSFAFGPGKPSRQEFNTDVTPPSHNSSQYYGCKWGFVGMSPFSPEQVTRVVDPFFTGKELGKEKGKPILQDRYHVVYRNCNSYSDALLYGFLGKRLHSWFSGLERYGSNLGMGGLFPGSDDGKNHDQSEIKLAIQSGLQVQSTTELLSG